MLTVNEIKLVEQTCENSCVAACLSMVTGLEIKRIIEVFDRDFNIKLPYNRHNLIAFLVREKIYPMHNENTIGTYIHNYSINILIVAYKSALHCIVLTKDSCGREKIFDPARSGKIRKLEDCIVICSFLLIDCSNMTLSI